MPFPTSNPLKKIRFGLRSLLVVMTVLCVILGLIAQPLAEKRREDEALAKIASLGGGVTVVASIDRDGSLGRTLLSFYDNEFARRRLYRINFAGVGLNDSQLVSVAQLEFIKHFDLSGAKVTDRGLRVLQNQEYLESLDLSRTGISDLSLPTLQHFRRLASLRVTDTRITYPALQQLDQKLPYAHFCEERAIEELTSAGVQLIAFPRIFESAEQESHASIIQTGNEAILVHFQVNHIKKIVAEETALLNHLQSLQKVTFNYVPFSPSGLAQLEPLPKLTTMSFSSIDLSDADLHSLGKQVQLQQLTINNCDQITDDGLAHLHGLKNLTKLTIEWCAGLTSEALAELEKALPGCECKFGP